MVLNNQQKVVTPQRLRYNNPTLTSYQGRITTKILANNPGSYAGNQQITIELPMSQGQFADFSNSYLSCNVKLTNSTQDVAFDDSSASFIKRLTIKSSNGTVIEDVTNYNELCAISEILTSSQQFTSGVGQILDGTSSKFSTVAGGASDYAVAGAKRIALATQGGKRNIKLISGLLNSTQLYPLSYAGCIIEIYLCSGNECGGIGSGSGTNVLEVSDVAFILETVQVGAKYENAFQTQYGKPEGITFHCPTWLSSINTIAGQNYTCSISENMKHIKTVWFYARAQAKNNVVSQRQTEVFEGKNLEYFQFRHGVRLTPQQKVDCRGTRSEAMAELLKSVNVAGSVREDLPFTLANYSDDANYGANGASTMAIFGVNMETDPDENMSGVNSNKQPLTLTLNYASAPANTNLYTFVNYDQVVHIKKSGVSVVY